MTDTTQQLRTMFREHREQQRDRRRAIVLIGMTLLGTGMWALLGWLVL